MGTLGKNWLNYIFQYVDLILKGLILFNLSDITQQEFKHYLRYLKRL